MKKNKELASGKKGKAAKSAKTSSSKLSFGAGENTDMLLRSLMDKEREILEAEDALVESMRRFRDLFEQSPIGVGIHDPKGELLIVNKAYLDIFGFKTFGQIKTQNLFSDFRITAKDAKKIRAGQTIQFHARCDFEAADLHSTNENAGYAMFTISPLQREEDIIGYLVQVQDITQHKKIEESQRLAQLGRLISDMAHEVNNPLMIISGRAEMALLGDIQDEKIKNTFEVILDQCFMAKEIILRLLKYSRLGKVEKTSVDVVKILDLIVEILNHHFKISNIVVETDIERGIPPAIGNEKQLQEVFMNVLRNSADAMPEGGNIKIEGVKEKDFLKIIVKDNGDGMSEEVLAKIFEPFFTTKQKGTGLGLAVCHTIIEDHGGKLLYESKPGKGTTATILLPCENVLI
ncbi:MAG: ATP-binding protein [Candidatus Tantalella remota]|nr:ATP-binding protein [Candidatus Tantalella remota]